MVDLGFCGKREIEDIRLTGSAGNLIAWQGDSDAGGILSIRRSLSVALLSTTGDTLGSRRNQTANTVRKRVRELAMQSLNSLASAIDPIVEQFEPGDDDDQEHRKRDFVQA